MAEDRASRRRRAVAKYNVSDKHRAAALRWYRKSRRAVLRRDEQRQHYRLAKQRWHYQMVRLDHDDIRVLRVVAQRERTTVAELIRTYITWGLEQHDGELDYDRDA